MRWRNVLRLSVPSRTLATSDVARLRTDFDAAHERAYGYAAPDDAVELVNVRLAAIGVTPRPRRVPLPDGTRDPAAAVKSTREVWFSEIGGWRKTIVLDRTKLSSGNVLRVLKQAEQVSARLRKTRKPSTATIEQLDGGVKPKA